MSRDDLRPDGTFFVLDSLVQRGPASWRASYHPVFPDGTSGERQWETLSGCRLKREAKAAAASLLSDLAAEAADGGEGGGDVALVDYAARVAAELRAIGKIGESTACSYVTDMRNFGDVGFMPLSEIGADDILEAVARMVEDGLSRNTVNSRVSLASRLFRYAIDDGLVRKNPCSRIPRLRREPVRSRALRDSEREALVAALDATDGFLRVAVKLALGTGMRGEEVCGLRWRDWHEEDRLVDVAWVCVARKSGGVLVKEPKTPESLRTLPVKASLEEELRRWRGRQEERCRAAGAALSPDHFVLGDPDGSPLSPALLRSCFRELMGALGLEGTFHWLRHTFATKLADAGVDAKTIATWLGHMDPGFTQRVYVDQSAARLAESLAAVPL